MLICKISKVAVLNFKPTEHVVLQRNYGLRYFFALYQLRNKITYTGLIFLVTLKTNNITPLT